MSTGRKDIVISYHIQILINEHTVCVTHVPDPSHR